MGNFLRVFSIYDTRNSGPEILDQNHIFENNFKELERARFYYSNFQFTDFWQNQLVKICQNNH